VGNPVRSVHAQLAFIAIQPPQEHGEQGGLTTAIGADQAEPVAGVGLESHVMEQQFAAAAQTHLVET
jgi:hypothetical protein